MAPVCGAWLLLHLPEKVFEQVVPVLLIAALVLVVIGPRIQEWARRRAEEAGRSAEHVSPRRMAALVTGTFAIGVYGGYFTAAQGILLIGAMGALLPESHAADERGEEPAVAGRQRRRGGCLHAGRVRPDQLGRRRD